MDAPLVSVVILNWNGKHFLKNCLSSVLNSDYPNFEIIFVDNASIDGSVEYVLKNFGFDKRLKVIKNNKNLGYTGGNNVGIKYAKGKYVVLLNNDTKVEPSWLRELVKVMELNPDVGIAQSKLLLLNNPRLIDCAGGFIDPFGYGYERGHLEKDKGQYDKVDNIFYSKGASIIIRREILKKVGLFDEDFFMYFDEADLCWRVWLAGYRVVLCPTSIVYHMSEGVTGSLEGKIRRFYYITRNSLTSMIKNYSFKSLIKYLPIRIFLDLFRLIINEIYILKAKTTKSKIPILFLEYKAVYSALPKAYLHFLLKMLPKSIASHRSIQRIRKLQDKTIFQNTLPILSKSMKRKRVDLSLKLLGISVQ